MKGSRLTSGLLGAAFLALTACGNGAAVAGPGDAPPAVGMCAADAPDCDDTVDPDDGDQFDSESERESARAMVGLAEGELAPDVRIGRRGAEVFMLTEDYVLGRKTVELDPDADGVFRVTSVIVELPDGPETFSAS